MTARLLRTLVTAAAIAAAPAVNAAESEFTWGDAAIEPVTMCCGTGYSQTHSPDNRAFTLLFDRFEAELPLGQGGQSAVAVGKFRIPATSSPAGGAAPVLAQLRMFVFGAADSRVEIVWRLNEARYESRYSGRADRALTLFAKVNAASIRRFGGINVDVEIRLLRPSDDRQMLVVVDSVDLGN